MGKLIGVFAQGLSWERFMHVPMLYRAVAQSAFLALELWPRLNVKIM